MSIASKCDRCGECFDPYSITADFVKIDEYRILDKTWATNALKQFKDRKSNIDLCPECTAKFLKFMNKEQDDAIKYVLEMYHDEKDQNIKIQEEHTKLVSKAYDVYGRLKEIDRETTGPRRIWFKAQIEHSKILELVSMLISDDDLVVTYRGEPCTGDDNSESICDCGSAERESETE